MNQPSLPIHIPRLVHVAISFAAVMDLP